MTRDHEIFQEIVKFLLEMDTNQSKPEGLVMKAQLSPENDHCSFSFYYIINSITTCSSDISGVAMAKIHNLLVELRNFYLANNQPYWKGCNFEVNLETGKIGVEFIYD